VNVYDDDGRVASMREEPLKQHDTLTFDVDGGKNYYIELEPEDNVVADYTLEYQLESRAGDRDLSDVREDGITLYRPGVGAHGRAVLTSVDPQDVLGQLGPLYGGPGNGGETERCTPGSAGRASPDPASPASCR
jgi:hypothetical protein